jgi:hypothetical protein
MCKNGHPFEPGVDVDMAAEGRSPDRRWCNTCGETGMPVVNPVGDPVDGKGRDDRESRRAYSLSKQASDTAQLAVEFRDQAIKRRGLDGAHEFTISIEVRGNGANWTSMLLPRTVAAYDLRDALLAAIGLDFPGWFPDDSDEGGQHD